MAFGGWAASRLLRNRSGRREGLECAPFDLRRATAPAGLSNPGSKALGALCDGWAFSPTPIGPGDPDTVWIHIWGKHPLPKTITSLSQAAKYDRSRYKQTINQTLIVTFSFLIVDRWL